MQGGAETAMPLSDQDYGCTCDVTDLTGNTLDYIGSLKNK